MRITKIHNVTAMVDADGNLIGQEQLLIDRIIDAYGGSHAIVNAENPDGTVNIWQQLDDENGNLVLNEEGNPIPINELTSLPPAILVEE